MIKLCSFEFEPFESPNYWADFLVFGAKVSDKIEFFDNYRKLELQLDPEDTYQMAMDQSTSNSGIIIKNYKNTRVYLIEVSRDRTQDAGDYIFDLEMCLHKIGEGIKFSHIIYERPITSESYRSSQVLFQLEGMLQGLPKRYPEFRTAQLDNITNSEWRSIVIDEEFAKYSRKAQSEESVCKAFPWVRAYGDSLGKDLDIFEAIGIMFGWFSASYDRLGRPYVRGDKYTGNIGGFILPFQSAEEVANAFEEAGIKAAWRIEHPRKSIYENIAAGIEHYKVKCVEISDPAAMLALTIECNMKWLNPDKMTIVLVAANYVDSRLFEITGKEYHFVF